MSDIVVVEQKTVHLDRGEIVGLITADETTLIPLRQFCDYLGVDWSAQRKRTMGHHFYSRNVSTVAVTATDGKKRNQLCLNIEYVHGWLLGLNPERIADKETAQKVREFQEVAHKLLYEAFRPEPTGQVALALSINVLPRLMEFQNEMAQNMGMMRLEMNQLKAELDHLRKIINGE